jgi:hypothetical protein
MDSFEVAELQESFLKRHTSGHENSIKRVGLKVTVKNRKAHDQEDMSG